MQFYKVIENRTSIKKFKQNKLNQDKVARMINAAMMSPSWKNAASYKFIIVEDEQKKEQISQAINNKSNDAEDAIKKCPMVVIVVADPKTSGIVDNKEMYLVDSAIAMEHFILAATEEGYGTCWIAALDENKIKNTLEIPNDYRVIALTPVGEIEEKKNHYEKKDVREYVFLDLWNKPYTENDNILH